MKPEHKNTRVYFTDWQWLKDFGMHAGLQMDDTIAYVRTFFPGSEEDDGRKSGKEHYEQAQRWRREKEGSGD